MPHFLSHFFFCLTSFSLHFALFIQYSMPSIRFYFTSKFTRYARYRCTNFCPEGSPLSFQWKRLLLVFLLIFVTCCYQMINTSQENASKNATLSDEIAKLKEEIAKLKEDKRLSDEKMRLSNARRHSWKRRHKYIKKIKTKTKTKSFISLVDGFIRRLSLS